MDTLTDRGKTQSVGNVPRPFARQLKIQTVIGMRRGSLTITAGASPDKRGKARLICTCDCGNTRECAWEDFRRGDVTRCTTCVRSGSVRHGHARRGDYSPEYIAWDAMHQRCRNPNCKGYREYGARGIAVCEQWNDFTQFLKDVGPKPSQRHSLDRFPDNNGNYEPGNVRWATPYEQSRNKRNNRYVVLDGKRELLCDIATKYGIYPGTVANRLRRGMPIKEALRR